MFEYSLRRPNQKLCKK